MPTITADDGVRAPRRDHRHRCAAAVHPRVRRRPPELGAAGAVLLRRLPLHHLRGPRVPAVGCARRCGRVLPGTGRRGRDRRAGRARRAPGPRGRACRWAGSPPCTWCCATPPGWPPRWWPGPGTAPSRNAPKRSAPSARPSPPRSRPKARNGWPPATRSAPPGCSSRTRTRVAGPSSPPRWVSTPRSGPR